MTRRAPRPPHPTALRARGAAILTALTLLCGLTACAATADPSETISDAEPATRRSELADLWAQFRETVDVPDQPLSVGIMRLKPPAGFTSGDVDALAQRAVSVLKRSVAPQLSKMDPDEAVDFVYAPQPALTKFDFERDAIKTTQGNPWQSMAASRFPTTPSEARVIRVAAKAKRYDGTLVDGTPAPYLTVTVEAHLVQDVPVTGDEFGDDTTAPIVSYRSVSASSFRPRGGPDFWPSVRARMSPMGNDGCALTEESTLLVPLTDPDVLREDLANLKSTLRSPEVSTAFNFDAGNISTEARRNMDEQADAFRQECDNRS